MVLAAGLAPALATFSTSGLFYWTTRAKTLEPPAGVAPAGSLYKSEPQAAAWRQKRLTEPKLNERRHGRSLRCAPEGRAYETHLSAGSTAPCGNLSLSLRLLMADHDRNGEGRRIRTSDLMHVRHPLWLAELYPRKWWGRRVLPSLPLACHTSALLMSYIPENWSG